MSPLFPLVVISELCVRTRSPKIRKHKLCAENAYLTHSQARGAPPEPCEPCALPLYIKHPLSPVRCAQNSPCVYAPLWCLPWHKILLFISIDFIDDKLSTSCRTFYGTPFCNFECCHFVGPEPVRDVQCQSSCGPTAEIDLREHLRESQREGLGKESTRIGYRDAQNKRFGHAC